MFFSLILSVSYLCLFLCLTLLSKQFIHHKKKKRQGKQMRALGVVTVKESVHLCLYPSVSVLPFHRGQSDRDSSFTHTGKKPRAWSGICQLTRKSVCLSVCLSAWGGSRQTTLPFISVCLSYRLSAQQMKFQTKRKLD